MEIPSETAGLCYRWTITNQVVSCRFISESPSTYKSGNIQILLRCAYKISPSGNGWGHLSILHWSHIRRIAQECAEVFKGVKPQKLGYLVHKVLNDRTFQRQLLTGIQLTGCLIRVDEMFLWHFPRAWRPLDKIFPVQNEEWQGILLCNMRN